METSRTSFSTWKELVMGRRLFPAHYKEQLLGMLQPHSRWWGRCSPVPVLLDFPQTASHLFTIAGPKLPSSPGPLGWLLLFGVHYWFVYVYAHEFMCAMGL